MKQVLFMVATLTFGVWVGLVEPVLAFAPYYLYAIVQPHELWAWALPAGVRWSLVAAGLAFLFVILHAPRLFGRMTLWPMPMLLGIYGGLLCLSTLTAFDPNTAGNWLGVVLKTVIVAAVVAALINSWSHVVVFAGTILIGAGILAWHFNSLYFFEGRLDILFRGLGALDNNGAALSVLLGLPFAYAFALGAHRLWVRGAAVFAGGLIVHAVMLSYSRGAMLAAVVGLGWLGVQHRPRRQLLWAVPLVIVGLGFAAGNEVRQEFHSIYDGYETDASVQSRFTSWSIAWEMAWDRPLTGMGLRNSNLYSFNFGADRRGRTIHNQYLQLAADAGIPALLAYLSILGVGFFGAYRGRRILEEHLRFRLVENPQDRTRFYAQLCLATEAAILTFCAAAMFLSLETLEMVLLIAALGAAAPALARAHVDAAHDEEQKADDRDALPKPHREQIEKAGWTPRPVRAAA